MSDNSTKSFKLATTKIKLTKEEFLRHAAEAKLAAKGKDSKGRFVKGHKGGPGRPPLNITVKDVREKMISFSVEVAEELYMLFKKKDTGDKDKILIARLMFDFCLPKPYEESKGNNEALEKLVEAISGVGEQVSSSVEQVNTREQDNNNLSISTDLKNLLT